MLLVLLFGVFLTLMVIGVPIAFAMGVSAVITLIVGYPSVPLTLIASRPIDAIDHWIWLAVPLFLSLGYLMNTTGVTVRLVRFSQAIIGHVHGGLSHVAVLTNVLLAGMSGAVVADASAVGSILIPPMKEEGYAPGYAAGVVGASAVIGNMIPPSINLLIIGEVGDLPVLRLWLGGAVPGLVIGVLLIAIGYLVSKKRNYPKAKRASLAQMGRTGVASIPALIIPFVILLGMRLGIFTPTEAGGVAVVYVLLVGGVIYRELRWKGLINACWQSAKASGAVMLIIAMAALMGWVIATQNVGVLVTGITAEISTSKVVFLLLVSIIMVFLGCFIDVVPNTVIFFPLFLPAAVHYGIDPIHFGVLFSYLCIIGLFTPPVGIGMYLVSGIAGIPAEEFIRDGGIFVVGLFACIPIFALFPQLILWLPNLILGPQI